MRMKAAAASTATTLRTDDNHTDTGGFETDAGTRDINRPSGVSQASGGRDHMNEQPNGHEHSSLFDQYVAACRDGDHPEAIRLRLALIELARKPPRPESPSTIERPARSPGAGARKFRGRRF